MFSWLRQILSYRLSERNGEQMLMGTLVACVMIATLALKSTGMSSLSMSSFATAGDITIAQEYALSRAESLRALKYSELTDVPLKAVVNSNGFYEEVNVEGSVMNTSVSGGVDTSVSSKNITIKIYKGDGEERKLCTVLSLNRVDPVSFDSEINMVTNDSDSGSLYKAMSADAFKDLVDSKVVDDKNSESDNLCLSASALKEYLKDKLETYSKTLDSVWYDGNSAVGSDYQGVYVKATGEVLPGSVVYRGNVTNASHALIIVPFLGSDNVWHYDFVDRADLYTKFIDQLYFTFTITQSPHQTIIVTTADGVEHTESFSVKYGTKWTASIVADSGYKVGVLSATSGIIKGITSISATAAISDKPPYTKVSWTTPGTYTWIVPKSVTIVKLTVAGAGGGSGGTCDVSRYPDGDAQGYGGAGGTGQLLTKKVTVIAGTNYSIVVGSAGVAGKNARVRSKHVDVWAGNGSNGGSSEVVSLLKALGGGGGIGGGSSCSGGDCYSLYRETHAVWGANGISYSGGAKANNNGWVIIEYGGDI